MGFKPPHFPKKRTAFGMIAESKSIIVAAFELPIPKLMMVISSAEAFGIEPFNPRIGTWNLSAKISTYFVKFVNRMYDVKSHNCRSVYLGNQFSTISCFVFIQ